MQPADLGTVVDLSRGLLSKNRRMAEEHIGYVVKETVKVLQQTMYISIVNYARQKRIKQRRKLYKTVRFITIIMSNL